MHISAYSGKFRNYSGIFRILHNPGIFRTLVYSKSKEETYSEPYQTSRMEHFGKIYINSYTQALRSRGAEGASASPKFADNVPFFLKSLLNVPFFENI